MTWAAWVSLLYGIGVLGAVSAGCAWLYSVSGSDVPDHQDYDWWRDM